MLTEYYIVINLIFYAQYFIDFISVVLFLPKFDEGNISYQLQSDDLLIEPTW